MRLKFLKILVAVMSGFIALTAIGGVVAMLTGLDKFPLSWLVNTPFDTYTVPALLLILVGASSLFAALTLFKTKVLGVYATMVAGALMAGYIVVEVLVLEQTPPGPTWTEYLYFGLGTAVPRLGLYLWFKQERLGEKRTEKRLGPFPANNAYKDSQRR